MNSFLTLAGPYLNAFPRINIHKNYELKIQHRVLELLELKDMGQLRDKYEGERYYLTLLEKLAGIIALEKYLKIKLADIETISKTYEPIIIINDIIIDIVIAPFGEFPLVDQNPNRPAIILLNKDNKTIYICGLATIDTLIKNLLRSKTTVSNKGKSLFTGFNQLKPFLTIEELKCLL